MASHPSIPFHTKVRVHSIDPATRDIDGRLGYVAGITEHPMDDGRFGYGVFIYDLSRVWCCREAELELIVELGEVLFVVQDCFAIKGRGTVVTAQVSVETERRLTKGLKIALRHESGFERNCVVRGVEHFMDAMGPNPPVGILVSLDEVKVPEGAKAFACDQQQAP